MECLDRDLILGRVSSDYQLAQESSRFSERAGDGEKKPKNQGKLMEEVATALELQGIHGNWP